MIMRFDGVHYVITTWNGESVGKMIKGMFYF